MLAKFEKSKFQHMHHQNAHGGYDLHQQHMMHQMALQQQQQQIGHVGHSRGHVPGHMTQMEQEMFLYQQHQQQMMNRKCR